MAIHILGDSTNTRLMRLWTYSCSFSHSFNFYEWVQILILGPTIVKKSVILKRAFLLWSHHNISFNFKNLNNKYRGEHGVIEKSRMYHFKYRGHSDQAIHNHSLWHMIKMLGTPNIIRDQRIGLLLFFCAVKKSKGKLSKTCFGGSTLHRFVGKIILL